MKYKGKGWKISKRKAGKISKKLKVRKAVWQFMKDHAQERPDGKLYISFVCDDESNFWTRVNGREHGYKRII